MFKSKKNTHDEEKVVATLSERLSSLEGRVVEAEKRLGTLFITPQGLDIISDIIIAKLLHPNLVQRLMTSSLTQPAEPAKVTASEPTPRPGEPAPPEE